MELSETAERDLKAKEHTGLGYAWGRQDAGDEPRDSGRAQAFAEAYASHWRAYYTGQVCHVPNIEDAYSTWRVTGQVWSR